MKHIAILTSGGDAPGMNAAIRAVVRTSIYHKLEISGVYQGYQGLIDDELEPLIARSVANIVQRGGTMLRSARCQAFYEAEGRAKAAETLHARAIDGLVVIGGDGSFRGGHFLGQEHGIPVVGIPGTIDNDIAGTDVTIGFYTAMDIALEAIDRLRDTAASHDRLFLVEVMGRSAGHIALHVGVAGGAEAIMIPEAPMSIASLSTLLTDAEQRGKSSSIIVVAEGAYEGGATALAKAIQDSIGMDMRVTILGHIQRGGSPCTKDRVLASRLGYAAVKALLSGRRDVMVGLRNQEVVHVPLQETWQNSKGINHELVELARVLAI